MNNPVSSQPRQRVSHRRRLALHVTIGMLMVSIAAAGYMFLGPSSGTAIGDHDQRADLAAKITAATPVITATVAIDDPAPAVDDLDAMRSEMKAITDQVNVILGLSQPVAATPAASIPIQGTGAARTQSAGGE